MRVGKGFPKRAWELFNHYAELIRFALKQVKIQNFVYLFLMAGLKRFTTFPHWKTYKHIGGESNKKRVRSIYKWVERAYRSTKVIFRELGDNYQVNCCFKLKFFRPAVPFYHLRRENLGSQFSYYFGAIPISYNSCITHLLDKEICQLVDHL